MLLSSFSLHIAPFTIDMRTFLSSSCSRPLQKNQEILWLNLVRAILGPVGGSINYAFSDSFLFLIDSFG